jgi:endonuclease YncB( thermonuclease family)
MKARAAVLAALCLIAACGPDLGGLERGEDGRVAGVQGGAALSLETSDRVLLAEIDAPRGDAPFAAEARVELETLAQGRKVRLAYGGAKRLPPRPADAANADAEAPSPPATAHVFVQSEGGRWFWLQHELVSRGAAFVRPRPANHARTRELLAVEAEARAAKRGLWALPEYRVLGPVAAAEAARAANVNCRNRDAPYRIVEGAVADADVQQHRASLVLEAVRPPRRGAELIAPVADAAADAAPAPFSIVIFGDAFADWDGAPLFSFEGERLRARGALGMFRGAPQLCVDRSEQIEVLRRS